MLKETSFVAGVLNTARGGFKFSLLPQRTANAPLSALFSGVNPIKFSNPRCVTATVSYGERENAAELALCVNVSAQQVQ